MSTDLELIFRTEAARMLSKIGDYYMDILSPIFASCQHEYYSIASMSPDNVEELGNIIALCDYHGNRRNDKIETDEKISNKVNIMIDNTSTFLKKVIVREAAQTITEKVIGNKNDK